MKAIFILVLMAFCGFDSLSLIIRNVRKVVIIVTPKRGVKATERYIT